ncbi:Cell wall-binding protein YocH [bioreactor metagenome]|uniref:Cell wall-binding protein YocH n=1 Tax=bioreactor metagenome TaxID=1076179 RepID=A0A645FW04_9ZZZZ
MVATAYTRYDEGCGDYTYRGTYLRRGLVAVDPDVIPLGTKLYIPGYGHAMADDIGGAIQGNRIDLAMDTLNEAYNFGIRNVTVYVL